MVDIVNTYEEPVEDASHVEAMLEKAEQLENPTPERPDWLPEKFKSAEDMASAYASLEKKLGQNPEEGDADEYEDTIGNQEESTDAVRDELADRGLDFDSFSGEFESNGELSEDSYDALAQAGIPPEVVDQYISGLQAETQMLQQQAFSLAGGEQEYSEMTQWAADNLSESEVDAYNRAVNSGDWTTVQMAIKGLSAQYRSEVGVEPSLVRGSTAGLAGDVFNSVAELTAAMRDPRYGTDSAYRQQISARLSRSNIL